VRNPRRVCTPAEGLSRRHDDLDSIYDGIHVSDRPQNVQYIATFVGEADRTVDGHRTFPDDKLQPDGIEAATRERAPNVSG
jgi:hypothetical protein